MGVGYRLKLYRPSVVVKAETIVYCTLGSFKYIIKTWFFSVYQTPSRTVRHYRSASDSLLTIAISYEMFLDRPR